MRGVRAGRVLLRAGEIIDAIADRVGLRSVTGERISRQAARVVRSHSLVAFDGARLVPEVVLIEVNAAIADACPEMFDRYGCAAVANRTAARVYAAVGFRPDLTIVFERTTAIDQSFRVGTTRRLVRCAAPTTGVRPTVSAAEGTGTMRPLRTAAELVRLWGYLESYGSAEELARRAAIDSRAVAASAGVRRRVVAGEDVADHEVLDGLDVARALVRGVVST